MGQLRQIQVRFEAGEDRLLLRVNTHDQSELRFWLTRRMVKRLWPPLAQALTGSPEVHAQADPLAKAAVLAFQREQALSNADFATRYREDAASLPLGTAPVLVSRAAVKPLKDGGAQLSLHDAEGRGANLSLGRQLLHSFCKLLVDASEGGDWGLGLRLADDGAQQRPTVSH